MSAIPKSASPTVSLRMEAARRLGCEVEMLDPETGYLYEVRRGGRALVLLGAYSPLNDASAARIATDKFHTGLVLDRAGFRVPASARCLQPGRYDDPAFAGQTGTEPARVFAAAHGYPLIVKPNRGARGRDVLAVDDEPALIAAVERVWRFDYLALVQAPAAGIDVRLDFLDGAFLFGYLRQPVAIVGDGARSVGALLAALDTRFADPAFQARLAADPILAGAGSSLTRVPAAGEELVFETPVMNLNRLCLAERIADPPAAWVAHGLAVGRALGLRHFGVDFKSAGLAADPRDAVVIDVNASPSLVHMSRMGHYEATVEAEMKVIASALAAQESSR